MGKIMVFKKSDLLPLATEGNHGKFKVIVQDVDMQRLPKVDFIFEYEGRLYEADYYEPGYGDDEFRFMGENKDSDDVECIEVERFEIETVRVGYRPVRR